MDVKNKTSDEIIEELFQMEGGSNKTSDEILEELFSELNVPMSPKAKGVPVPSSEVKEASGNSIKDPSVNTDESEDKEADSKSSDSETEPREQKEKVTRNHKHKSSKKKKEKKKKKKHKKKDDDSRHKSKKKHKKASDAESEEIVILSMMAEPVVIDGEAVAKKLIAVNSEKTEKSCNGNSHEVEDEVKILSKNKSLKSEDELSKSKSPKSEGELDRIVSQPSKEVNKPLVSSSKEDAKKPVVVVLKSPQRPLSQSRSVRSRSRSTSRVKHRSSRSRSTSRVKQESSRSSSKYGRHTRSRSRSKYGRHTRSRSCSRSKHGSEHSRSRSRTKTSRYKSKAKSPYESEKYKYRRSSRSYSRSLSPKPTKRRKTSRSHSRSPSHKKGRRSYSRSLSPKLPRKRRYLQSRSPSHTKTSKHRSRSRSGSRKTTSRTRETPTANVKPIEVSSSRSDALKTLKAVEIDLNSIPTPDVQQSSVLPIVPLDSIPLPIPPASSSSKLPDPSSIPLPQPVTLNHEEKSGKDEVKDKSNGIDLGTIPVPGSVVEIPPKDQDSSKPADTGTEKNKGKVIVIKSLKDSLIYMQAQEEAERRAKNKQDGDLEPQEEVEEQDDKEEVKEDDDEEGSEEHEIVEEVKVNDILVSEEKENAEEIEKESEKTEEKVEAEVIEVTTQEIKEVQVVESATKKDKKELKYDVEDGEIVSDTEDTKTKSHKKKSKKDKDKNKEKKKSKKDKSKSKKKEAKEKSRSKERSVRSRSRSKERSKHKRSSSSRHREHDGDWRHRRHSRSRSRSRDRHARFRHRSYSRSRSRSRSGRKKDCVSDLRDKVTRKRLLEIARRNAVYLMQNGCLPPSVEQEQLVKIKTSGKSVEELTDFCKQLVATGNYSDADLSDGSLSSDEDNDNPDKPFSYTRHPFSVRDSKPILMNIRNAPMLPTKTNAERLADHAKLREQFPVSSGSQHRNKGEVNTTEDKLRTADSGWVPVSPKEKKPKEEDSVFSKDKTPSVDISQIVSSRLSAMRKLQDNPHDMEAIKTLHNVQKEMQTWALSKQEPGQFTGSTGVKILSQEELCAGQQAWVRKEQFKEAAPVRPQFGLKMLQKMGWTPGEGLGKNKEGAIEPLLLDVKMDKKGFHAQEELTPKKQPIPMAKDLSGKHPVSALVELCSKHKWQPPEFEMVFDYGPDHKKNFLMKVKVNGQEYKPAVAGPTKKLAKANAAAACLQSLGLLTKGAENLITEAALIS